MSVVGDHHTNPRALVAVPTAKSNKQINSSQPIRSIAKLSQLTIITKQALSSSTSNSSAASSSTTEISSTSPSLQEVRDAKRSNSPSNETYPAGLHNHKRQKLLRSCKTSTEFSSSVTQNIIATAVTTDSEDEAEYSTISSPKKLVIKRAQPPRLPPPIPAGIILHSGELNPAPIYSHEIHSELNPATPWILSSFNPTLTFNRRDTYTCIRTNSNQYSVSSSSETPSYFSKLVPKQLTHKTQNQIVNLVKNNDVTIKKTSTVVESSSSALKINSSPLAIKTDEIKLDANASSPDQMLLEIKMSEEQNKWWHWAKNCKYTGDGNKSSHLVPLRCWDLTYLSDDEAQDHESNGRGDDQNANTIVETSLNDDVNSSTELVMLSRTKTNANSKIATKVYCPNTIEFQRFYCSDIKYPTSITTPLKERRRKQSLEAENDKPSAKGQLSASEKCDDDKNTDDIKIIVPVIVVSDEEREDELQLRRSNGGSVKSKQSSKDIGIFKERHKAHTLLLWLLLLLLLLDVSNF
ncbi:hypothetical protein BY996DRAFT_6412319 [Phakopsora pachyrhizi]|nr:hypothetical protein BY996DRAFT_6412319 [Phakopsora pachyrhizi]